MSKFLELCEKVKLNLVNEQEMQGTQMEETPEVAPGQPMPDQGEVLDPQTQTEVQEVSNEKIQELIEVIINFFQKGTPLSSDTKMEVDRLPAKINSENSAQTVDTLINILSNSNFPSNSFDTSQ
jgi:hypothetical protein